MAHPPNRRRRSLRLPGWDYRAPAYYFVTICTYRRQTLFDDTTLRDTVALTWRLIPTQPHARGWLLDEWVVMPNHLHGILLRPTPPPAGTDPPATLDEAALLANQPFDMRFMGQWGAAAEPTDKPRRGGAAPGSLSAVVGSFKSAATQRINALRRSPGCRVWQRGYYERIVRNDHELERIRVYIRQNPSRWAEDRENLDALLEQMTYRQ